ncbi:zinc finger domain-containing protein [Streptomyces scabiei]|uniref:zinc finger domain-containing protein n=1 Tax=Streptomyces scabiei TaxID=1930 RepID=UPI003F4D0941
MDLTPDQSAIAVEQNEPPKCEAPAGSPCRTRGAKTAAKYHTARFILVPVLREELEVPVPEDRGPSRLWKRGQPVVAPAAPTAKPIRISYARVNRPTGTRQPARRARTRVEADLIREDLDPCQDPP